MTGNKESFLSLTKQEMGNVTFGNNLKGRIVGIGKISLSSSLSIDDVYLVEDLKHNLISISQLCDKGHRVLFSTEKCSIYEKGSDKILIEETRRDNIYVLHAEAISLSSHRCRASTTDQTWL